MRRAQYFETRTLAGRAGHVLAWFGLSVALAGGVVVRLGHIEPVEALAVICSGWALSGVALLLSAAGMATVWRDGARGGAASIAGLLVSLLALAWPATVALQLWRAPDQADIATDAADPPVLSVALADAPALARAGRSVSRSQFPALPLFLDRPPAEALADAEAAAHALGWQVVAVTAGPGGGGHFEAVARSDVLHFPQYVAVRIRPTADGSQLDMRVADPWGFLNPGSSLRRILDLHGAVQEVRN